jgi:T5SS/PEP-CTERM-associated repeat protein/autotransporter-associated beta strand protein
LTVGSGGQVKVNNALSFWSANASVTVDRGTLRAGTLTSQGAVGSITLQANPIGEFHALELDGAADGSFAGVLAGIGGLLKSGTGKLTLSGANPDYLGTTTISGGQIILGHHDALRRSVVSLEVDNGLSFGGLAQATLAGLSGTGALALGSTALVLDNSISGGPYYGNITGTGSVTKNGKSLATWLGTSQFDKLQVNEGRVFVAGGSLTLANTAQGLMVGGGVLSGPSPALDIGNGATVSATGNTVQVDGNTGTQVTITGTGSRLTTGFQMLVGNHAAGKLQIDGGGTLNATTYLGMGFDQNGNGTLQVGAGGTVTSNIGMLGVMTSAVGTADVAGSNALWSTNSLTIGGFNNDLRGGTGMLTVRNGGSVQVRDTLSFWSAAAGVTVDGGSLRAGMLSSTLGQGSITLTADPVGGAALELTGAADSSFAGILAGGGTLLKTGTRAQTLAGASPGFTGITSIRGGQIVVGHQDALRGSMVSIEVANGLNVNGLADVVVGSLAGNGALALGNTQFTLGEDNRSTTYGGVLTGAGAVLVKKGTGAFTMTAGGSSISRLVVEGGGAMVLDGGNLALTSGSTSAAALALNAGGRLELRRGAQLNATFGDLPSIYLAGDAATELIVDGVGTSLNGGFQTLVGVSDLGHMTVRNGGRFTGTFALGAGFNTGSSGTISFESGAQGVAPLVVTGINPGSSGTVRVSGPGTLVQATSSLGLGGATSAQNGGTGRLEISDGGTVVTPLAKFWTAASSIRIDGGNLTATGLESEAGAGAITLVSDAADRAALILGAGPGSYSYGGSIDGDGSVTKTGVGAQVLAGPNSFTGKVTVQGGTLTMGSSAASEYEVGAFGTLRLGERNLGFAVVQANAGGQVVYTSSTLNGGQLIGPGGHDIGAVRRLVGTRIGGGTSLAPVSDTTFVGVVNEGNVYNQQGRSLTWTSGSNPTGTVLVAGTTTVSNFTSGGQLQVGPTGTLVSTSGNLVLGGGSRTTVGAVNSPGGTIELRAGGRVQLNGGLLVNNGSILGTTEVNYGSLAKGAGTYGAVIVNDGGRFSPGNSPGSVTTDDATWGAGGSLVVELAQAGGAAGIDWDLWTIHGALSVAAGNTANSRFTVSLATLDGSNLAAPLAGFDAHRSWSWRIVDTDGGITGFDTSRVALDTQGFLSPLAGGTLRLAAQDGDLYLQFNPAAVPEPQTWALLLAGLGVLGWAARRRRAD